MDRQLREALQVLVESLPDFERRVIEAMYYEGLGLRRTAAALSSEYGVEVTKNQVRHVHQKALGNLREIMTGADEV